MTAPRSLPHYQVTKYVLLPNQWHFPTAVSDVLRPHSLHRGVHDPHCTSVVDYVFLRTMTSSLPIHFHSHLSSRFMALKLIIHGSSLLKMSMHWCHLLVRRASLLHEVPKTPGTSSPPRVSPLTLSPITALHHSLQQMLRSAMLGWAGLFHCISPPPR